MMMQVFWKSFNANEHNLNPLKKTFLKSVPYTVHERSEDKRRRCRSFASPGITMITQVKSFNEDIFRRVFHGQFMTEENARDDDGGLF